MCELFGVTAVFACRMLPKSWINELVVGGGFALIMKYQLYPPWFRGLVREVRGELGLPVDCPRRLEEGTMRRLVNWHRKRV